MKTAVLIFASASMLVSVSMLVSGEPGNASSARDANSDLATTENTWQAKRRLCCYRSPNVCQPTRESNYHQW